MSNKPIEEIIESLKPSILENLPLLVAVHDRENKLIWANREYLKSTDKTLAEIVGKKCYHVWNLEKACKGCPVESSMNTGRVEEAELTPENQDFWPESQGSWVCWAMPLKDSGEIIGAVEVAYNITGRVDMENDLKRVKSFQNAIINCSPVAIYSIDLDGNVLSWNKSAEKIFGWSAEEVIGKPLPIVPGDKQEEFIRLRERVKQGNEFKNVELIRKKKDGTLFEGSLSTAAMYDSSGNITGIISIMEDITSQRKAEEVLRQKEENYREIFNGMDTAWIIDFNGRVIDVNNTAVKVLGYSRQELLDIGIQGIDHALRWENVKELAENMPKDKVQVFETAHTAKDGKQIPVEIKSSLVHYQGKDAILSVARDITKRKKAEDALKENKNTLERIVQVVHVGLGIVSNRTVEWVNDYLLKIIGYSRDEVIGRDTRVFYPMDEEYQRVGNIFYEELRQKGSASMEVQWKHKDGRLIDVFLSGVSPDKGEPLLRTIFSVSDITESNRIEEERNKQLSELKIFQKASIGRELRMIELKNKIKELEEKLKHSSGAEPNS